MKRDNLATYLTKQINPRLVTISMILSGAMALFVSVAIVYFISSLSKAPINGISHHINSLIESRDNVEIFRVIKSFNEKNNINIEVIENEKIIATTKSLSRVGSPYSLNGFKLPFTDSFLTKKHLINSVDASRGENSAVKSQIVSYYDTENIVGAIITTGLLSFLLSYFLIKSLLVTFLEKTLKEELEPISKLDKAIRHLGSFENDLSLPDFKISELQNIRNRIISTQRQLKITCRRLAGAKAQSMTNDAYKNLLHDLQVPVAAVRQNLKIEKRADISEDVKNKVRHRNGVLLEQILNQLNAAKDSFSISIELSENDDIRESVSAAINEVQEALPMSKVKITKSLPDNKIIAKHDPANLKRACINLIKNAAEACNKIVEVVVYQTEGLIKIAVSDDGAGINSEDAMLFLQGRGNSNKENGSGRGLFSANHIIRSHDGGKIICKESKHGGAEFEIVLRSHYA